jgi:hypothetical protein
VLAMALLMPVIANASQSVGVASDWTGLSIDEMVERSRLMNDYNTVVYLPTGERISTVMPVENRIVILGDPREEGRKAAIYEYEGGLEFENMFSYGSTLTLKSRENKFINPEFACAFGLVCGMRAEAVGLYLGSEPFWIDNESSYLYDDGKAVTECYFVYCRQTKTLFNLGLSEETSQPSINYSIVNGVVDNSRNGMDYKSVITTDFGATSAEDIDLLRLIDSDHIQIVVYDGIIVVIRLSIDSIYPF